MLSLLPISLGQFLLLIMLSMLSCSVGWDPPLAVMYCCCCCCCCWSLSYHSLGCCPCCPAVWDWFLCWSYCPVVWDWILFWQCSVVVVGLYHITHFPGCCPCCPAVWDGFLCWPPAPLNTIVEQPCPGDFPQLNLASIGINIIVIIIITFIEIVNISAKYQKHQSSMLPVLIV